MSPWRWHWRQTSSDRAGVRWAGLTIVRSIGSGPPRRRPLPAFDVQPARPVAPLARDAPPDRRRESFGDARRAVRDAPVAGDARRGDPAVEPLVLQLVAGVQARPRRRRSGRPGVSKR